LCTGAEGHSKDPFGEMPWEQDSWISLLMLAAQTGNAEMIELLIEYGADEYFEQPGLTFADGYGYGGITALMCAGMSPEATRALLDNGAGERCNLYSANLEPADGDGVL